MTLKPRADRPVDKITIWVIQEINKAAEELGFPVFLVGATARIILLENVFGLRAGRASYDVDFAFALKDWGQFNTIKHYLVTNSNFEELSGAAQRLAFRYPGEKYRLFVDLIPFGGIETQANMIAWPPDMSVIMNVAGYEDALAAAIPVEVSPSLTISVASLPGMVILKLFAWSDRGRADSKDAIDLASLLRGYYEAGNQERIYEDKDMPDVLESVAYNIELAGAWLLGKDAAAMASSQTSADLRELINGTEKRRLIEDMARAMLGREDALDYSHRLLEQFTNGFTT
jgi:predicted nucleotidyltransferase